MSETKMKQSIVIVSAVIGLETDWMGSWERQFWRRGSRWAHRRERRVSRARGAFSPSEDEMVAFRVQSMGAPGALLPVWRPIRTEMLLLPPAFCCCVFSARVPALMTSDKELSSAKCFSSRKNRTSGFCFSSGRRLVGERRGSQG